MNTPELKRGDRITVKAEAEVKSVSVGGVGLSFKGSDGYINIIPASAIRRAEITVHRKLPTNLGAVIRGRSLYDGSDIVLVRGATGVWSRMKSLYVYEDRQIPGCLGGEFEVLSEGVEL